MLSLFASHAALAADDDHAQWLMFVTGDHFDSGIEDARWRYSFDAQYRHFERNSGAEQYLLRPAVGYDVSENMSAWLGFTYAKRDPATSPSFNEQRIWQQLSWTVTRWGKTRLTARARLQERWRSNGDDLAVTLRTRAMLTTPISADDKFNLVVAAEPFVDFRDTDWGATKGLSRLRSSVAVTMRASDHWRFEFGYLVLHGFRDNATDNREHIGYLKFQLLR